MRIIFITGTAVVVMKVLLEWAEKGDNGTREATLRGTPPDRGSPRSAATRLTSERSRRRVNDSRTHWCW